MSTYTVRVAALRAALTHAAKKDVRFYLNGVCLDLDAGRIIATDGSRMFVCAGPQDAGMGQRIVPRDLLESVLKAAGRKMETLDIVIEGDSILMILPTGASFTGKAIDGKFPQWQRVIPMKTSGEPGQFDAGYMADAADALVTYGAAGATAGACVVHNGASNACIVYGATGEHKDSAFVVVMPLRRDEPISTELAAFMGVQS